MELPMSFFILYLHIRYRVFPNWYETVTEWENEHIKSKPEQRIKVDPPELFYLRSMFCRHSRGRSHRSIRPPPGLHTYRRPVYNKLFYICSMLIKIFVMLGSQIWIYSISTTTAGTIWMEPNKKLVMLPTQKRQKWRTKIKNLKKFHGLKSWVFSLVAWRLRLKLKSPSWGLRRKVI